MIEIVIPIYNEARLVIRCLRALRASTEASRLILVDDGSAWAERALLDDYLASASLEVRMITHEVNRGFKEAARSGLDATTGRQVILLNTDTVVTPGFDTRLIAALGEGGNVAAAAPVSNHPTDLYQYRPALYIAPETTGPALFERIARNATVVARGGRRTVEAPYLTGMCLAFDRELFEAAGGFGAEYRHGYFEDLALSARLRQQGHRLAVCEDCFVFHQGHASYRHKSSNEKIAIIQHNFRQFSQEWGDEPEHSDLLRRMELAGQVHPI